MTFLTLKKAATSPHNFPLVLVWKPLGLFSPALAHLGPLSQGFGRTSQASGKA